VEVYVWGYLGGVVFPFAEGVEVEWGVELRIYIADATFKLSIKQYQEL
jgi:hypothetical protein